MAEALGARRDSTPAAPTTYKDVGGFTYTRDQYVRDLRDGKSEPTDDEWAALCAESWASAAETDRIQRDHNAAVDTAKRVASSGYIDWSDSEFWNPPEPKVFVPKMLLETQVGTIYSRGGVGKSLLALDIVVGLCVRGSIFGQAVDPQTVIYIDRENSKRGLLKRLSSMGITAADAEELSSRLHYSLLGAVPALDSVEGGRWLKKEVERTGARFVIIDTLSKVVEGEENANPTWQGLHNHTMVALKHDGVTVLQIDHTGKDADRGQRGASAKRDNADVIWHLDVLNAAAGVYSLTCGKDRDGDFGGEGFRHHLIRDESPALHHRWATDFEVVAAAAQSDVNRADEIREAVIGAARAARGPLSQREAEEAVKGRREDVRSAYKDLKAEGILASNGTYLGAPEGAP